MSLAAPFPWFGGKRKVAPVVWERFGEVVNYVEPFFGSGAVLLGRPRVQGVETVNDRDGLVANFWRALQRDPEHVAQYADEPVNENDLHAKHIWLLQQLPDLVKSLRSIRLRLAIRSWRGRRLRRSRTVNGLWIG